MRKHTPVNRRSSSSFDELAHVGGVVLFQPHRDAGLGVDHHQVRFQSDDELAECGHVDVAHELDGHRQERDPGSVHGVALFPRFDAVGEPGHTLGDQVQNLALGGLVAEPIPTGGYATCDLGSHEGFAVAWFAADPCERVAEQIAIDDRHWAWNVAQPFRVQQRQRQLV
jgi:hypothetical protein